MGSDEPLSSSRSDDLSDFDGFRKQAGLHSFILTPKQWIEKTHAVGLVSKPGRYGVPPSHA